jgi:hypothetical protein
MKVKSFALLLLCPNLVLGAVGDKYVCELLKRPWIEEKPSCCGRALQDWPTVVKMHIHWKKDDVVWFKEFIADKKSDGSHTEWVTSRFWPDEGMEFEVEPFHPWQVPKGENKYKWGFHAETSDGQRDGLWDFNIQFFPNETSKEPTRLLFTTFRISHGLYNIHVWDYLCGKV